MARGPGTFELLARHLGQALHTLAGRLAGGGAPALFANLGLRPPRAVLEHDHLAAATADAESAAGDLRPRLNDLTDAIAADDPERIVDAGQRLAGAIGRVATAVDDLGAALDRAREDVDGLSPEEQAALAAFAAHLPRRTLDALVIEHVAARAPEALALAQVLGLADREPEAGDESPLHPPWMRRELHTDRLPLLLSDPRGYAREVYGWGDDSFDGVELLTRLHRYLRHARVDAVLITPPEDPPVLEAYLFSLAVDDTAVPPRLVASLRFAATERLARTFPLREPWFIEATAEGSFEADAQVLVDPPLSFRLAPPDGTANASAALRLVGERPGEPLLVFGHRQGVRLEAERVTAGLTTAAAWDADAGVARGRPRVEAQLAGGRLVLALDDADAFLATSLPGELALDVDLAAVWDEEGLRLRGGAGLVAAFPLSGRAGAVALERLDIELGVGADELALDARMSGAVDIGPCRVRLDGVGARSALALSRGNLGPVDLQAGFLAPRGLGLSIDAGPVSGGGFLAHHPEAQRYAGAVQLDMDGLAAKAVGLLTTRVPDATGGYALLALVAGADFPPVNLGFGFTLQGVGGLVGVNRTANVDELRTRLRGGALQGMVFPDDPFGSADELVGRLGAVFPPTPDRHLVGPAALIGWGTPTVLEIELVVALELPEPLRVVALAQLRARLPSQDGALVRLNMDALGVVDIDRGRAALDATLYDSSIADHAVEGEVALRARWSGEPDLVLAAGGLNPRYEPPQDFPELDRLSIRLERGRAQLRLEAYLALTSNTVQVGARVRLEVGVGRFTIDGRLQFDTLFERSPFAFVADFAGGVRVRWGDRSLLGVRLEMTLSGPAPLHARGRATFEVWRFSHSVSFDVALDGGEPPDPAPRADPLPQLVGELEDARSWSAPPPRDAPLVSLADPDRPDLALVHPLGQLTVRQRVLPLEVEVTQFGGTLLREGPHAFAVTVSLPDGTPAEARTVTDHFAPGQFLDVDRHDALSAPAFERLPSGVRLEIPDAQFGGQDDTGLATSAPVGHDTRVVDDGVVRAAAHAPLAGDALRRAVGRRAHVRKSAARAGRDRYRGPDLTVRAREPVYVVARTDDLRVESFTASGGADGLSHTAATQLLRRQRGRDDAPDLQVVARHEAVGALPGLLPPGASPEEPGEYEERGSFGARVPGARRVTMLPDSDPLPPTQAPRRRWQWVAPLEDAE